MGFYDQLVAKTEAERRYLLSAPAITETMEGRITLRRYVAFLTQAYYHVRHTVPLLMAVGARLPASQEWLRNETAEYIGEELGHDEWILDDLRTCGIDIETVRHGQPAVATELMVSYAWDMVSRVNPVGFFGMVLVLEGTSVALATRAAAKIRQVLSLPAGAFRYLTSHGTLDQQHIGHLQALLDRLDDPRDRDAVERCARMMYRLYGDVFRSLDNVEALSPVQSAAGAVA